MHLPFLVVGLLTLFIQISSNELLFRGYTMQFVRCLTTNFVLIIVVPAIVSAAPHLPNLIGMGQPTNGILIALINGCLYGWLAHRSRTLWMPLVFYWGNNLGITVLIGVKNSGDLLQGAAILVADKCHHST